jgi:hypothetical protein
MSFSLFLGAYPGFVTIVIKCDHTIIVQKNRKAMVFITAPKSEFLGYIGSKPKVPCQIPKYTVINAQYQSRI